MIVPIAQSSRFVGALGVLAIIFVALRMCARAKTIARYGLDDLLIIFALAGFTSLVAVACLCKTSVTSSSV